MKFKIDLDKVKIIWTPQGTYLKSQPPYRYMVARLPEGYHHQNLSEKVVEITVDTDQYWKRRIYRLDEGHISKYVVDL